MSLQLLKTICCLNENILEFNLLQFLKNNNYKVLYQPGDFILAEGQLPVCLIAHMDTVFNLLPQEEDFLYDPEKQILWSPYGSGFDDRAGVAMIIKLINAGYRPSIIFTNGEEPGGIGASALIKKYKKCPFKCNYLIELDRMGEKDCVFYSCGNQKFIDYIESFGFEENLGSFSDISIIAPAWKIAAVNLSIGYIDEHSPSERINLKWYSEIFNKVKAILDKAPSSKFYKYIHNDNEFFIGTKDKCFFCGKSLVKYIRIKEANGMSFYCCPSCYKEFYDNEDT